MTRRERLERKVEKRREWAQSAEKRAQQAYNTSQSLVANIPMGQPVLVGHHSERRHRRTLDRSWNALGRSVAETKKAEMHESKADHLETSLGCTIFSDDEDSVEALESRIAEREAERERMKKINSLYRKGDAAGLAEIGVNIETLKAKLAEAGAYWGSAPHLPYELSNLGARITADKKRLVAVKLRRERTTLAMNSDSGVVLAEFGAYCTVTFANKPDRAILDMLKASGFWWKNGCWQGQTAKLPESVKDMTRPENREAVNA